MTVQNQTARVIIFEDKSKAREGKAAWCACIRNSDIKIANNGDGNQQRRWFFPTEDLAKAKALELDAQQTKGGIITAHPERSVGLMIDAFCDRTNTREERGRIP